MSNIIKAIQKIYPNIDGGITYWESKYDGSALDSPEDGLIWENEIYSKPSWLEIEDALIEIALEEAKTAKKEEIIKARNSAFAKPLHTRSNPDLYLRPQPQVNIFLAAYSMSDGATKEWAPCDKDGNIQDLEVEFTKEELVSASNHYEERKTTQYNQARKRCRAVDALTTIEEVEAYDITTVYE